MTVFFLWLALRGVSFREVQRAIGRANWPLLLGLSIPPYLLVVYFRALRWRHITDPVMRIGTGPLFRAVAVGFMANNLFPLRMGEVVRSWYLARETGAPGAALFGTVILERVVDAVAVIALAALALALLGAEQGGVMATGAFALLPAALAPIAVLGALRAAPERVLGIAAALLRPFPARVGAFVDHQLRRFAEGLGALSGGSHLLWIAAHTVIIWGVLSPLPFLAGFVALGVPFESVGQMLLAGWLTLAAIGIAVAVPSAPGFFGPYQWACKLALGRFGVDEATAVALGLLFNTVFWGTLTALGLAVLRRRRTALGELEGVAEEARSGPAP